MFKQSYKSSSFSLSSEATIFMPNGSHIISASGSSLTRARISDTGLYKINAADRLDGFTDWLNLSSTVLKNDQIYFKNLAVRTPQDFYSMFVHFSI